MKLEIIIATFGALIFIYMYSMPVIKYYFEQKNNKKMVIILDKLILFKGKKLKC